MALLMVAALSLTAGCTRLSGLGGAAAGQAERPAALAVSAPSRRLQEMPPPGAVQQFSAELDGRQPQLRIVSPSDGTLLPAGPWPLTLAVQGWPLVDAGPLGLGAHVVVQIDDGPPQRIAGSPGSRTRDPQQAQQEQRLDLELPELAPGSHRLSVYAARPWGEAVKRPGAFQQIQLHRVAATPQTQPAAGSAQLIAVSPDGQAQAEPVLIDWLLRDAPLQGLRAGDGHWRLRITVNGDSFLVDQSSPLWLKGFRPGSNSVVMELLDGLGEPLNPPFNTTVREVVIDPASPRSPWLQSSLSPSERQQLLGLSAVAQPEPEPKPEPKPAAPAIRTSTSERAGAEASPQEVSGTTPVEPQGEEEARSTAAGRPPAEDRSTAAATASATDAPRQDEHSGPGAENAAAPDPAESPVAAPIESKDGPPANGDASATTNSASTALEATEPEPETDAGTTAATPAESAQATATTPPTAGPADDARGAGHESDSTSIPPDIETPMPPDQTSSSDGPAAGDRLQPGSSLGGSARELVHEDGSLSRSEPQGWLSRLSGRLQR